MEHLFNTQGLKRHISPTRLFWGVDSRRLLFEALKEARQVCLVVDRAVAGHPFIDEECPGKLSITSRFTVDREPKSRQIEAWAQDLPAATDAIVAVGGGSTMDAAKALRAHLAFGQWNVKDRPAVPGMPRLVTLPTIPASGSEVSRYYVITDSLTHEKRAHRAWSLCADCALLDPVWTEGLPAEILYPSAFDAFTHLWESFLCRQERSWFNEALCLEGLGRPIPAASRLRANGTATVDDRLELHYCAALGGMALSNVRTGLLHDSGEALAAQVSLSHPLTMTVFLEEALSLYSEVLDERLHRLRHALEPSGSQAPAETAQALGRFWMEGFAHLGLLDRVAGVLAAASPSPEPIIAKILSDSVLVHKESPLPLTEASVRDFVQSSLARFVR